MRKRNVFISILLASAMTAGLSGCGSGNVPTGVMGQSGNTQEQAVTVSPQEDQTPWGSSTETAAQPSQEGLPSQEGQTIPAEEQPSAVPAEETPTPAVPELTLVEPIEHKEFLTLVKPTNLILAQVDPYIVESGLANVSNSSQFYMSDDVKKMLEKNGFAVVEGTRHEFFDLYEKNRYNYVPNYVTVDSMMHTYHLYFMHLMKNVEKNDLAADLKELAFLMEEKSLAQLEILEGSEWETAALRNAAFFAVGCSLLDESFVPDERVAEVTAEELARIYDAGGIYDSLLTGNAEDYTQYIVRGYYDTDETLQRYFRAMMWFGRLNFNQEDEILGDDLDRSALLITLALDNDTFPLWEKIYTVTSFFAGSSDDNGYYEYKPFLTAAYGETVSAADLPGSDASFGLFHTLTESAPAPKINSIPMEDDGYGAEQTEKGQGFRFMGQRFSIDAQIMQNLVYSNVGLNSDGEARMLPDALDVPAALGSDEALEILEDSGAADYAGYSENMQKLRDGISSEENSFFSASLYGQWLYTLLPLLDEKGEGYPSCMQTDAWARKDLQSFLGSYTELKHDTVLYAKQVMSEMGGDFPQEADDRGYVEPEPDVFGRLEQLTGATSQGLDAFGYLADDDRQNLWILSELSGMLRVIAEKELTNETLTDEEYELIRSFGGQLEHFWQEVYKNEADREYFTSREFPAAVVTDIATDPNGSVLQIGTGGVSTIYVIVPVDGKLKICAGAVYSFYQFENEMGNRLSDSEWRYMMGLESDENNRYVSSPAESPEEWTKEFMIPIVRS